MLSTVSGTARSVPPTAPAGSPDNSSALISTAATQRRLQLTLHLVGDCGGAAIQVVKRRLWPLPLSPPSVYRASSEDLDSQSAHSCGCGCGPMRHP